MTVCGASILTNPPCCGHIVYPYTDETRVVEAVTTYAAAGLRKGDAVILVMRADNCKKVRRELRQKGFDPGALDGTGQLQCVDAGEMLSRFMVDGMPDEARFYKEASEVIGRAKAHAPGGRGAVRVFGEMVSILYVDNPAAALRLEELWNKVVDSHKISLFCTYCLSDANLTELPKDLAHTHSHYVV